MHISRHLDSGRIADLERDPNHCQRGAAEMAALRDAQARHQMLQPRAAEIALFGTASRAVQPASVAQRFSYDTDYGAFADHPMDPRTEVDDDALTEDDARSEATDQILSHAESVADWLAKACDTDEGRMPLDVTPLDALAIIEGSPAVLLTVLMNGNNTQALRAMHRLRELAAANFRIEIEERTADLLREAA